MEERKGGPLFGIGGVTLLTVLLVLCLTLFAVLALSAAQADWRLSEKNAETVLAYYAAENEAYALINAAEDLLLMLDGGASAGTIPESVLMMLGVDALLSENLSALGYEVAAEADGGGVLLSADIPVLRGSVLRVALFLESGDDAPHWEVRQWQLFPPAQDDEQIAFLPLLIP